MKSLKTKLKRLTYSLLANVHREKAQQQIRTLEKKLVTRNSRFALPYVFSGSGYFESIEPKQNPVEIEELYKIVCKLSPKRILEIGTYNGGTLYLWAYAAQDDASIVSVDLPGGDFGGSYAECRIPFYKSFVRSGQKIYLLHKDSHQTQTLEEVRKLLKSHPIDLAFIDGDHTYEGVKSDFIMYGPLVRPGGIIAFHDILPRPEYPNIQVDRFWKEVRDKYDTTELIGPEIAGRAKTGIGIIRVGKEGINFSDSV